jgi:hypothetical protein
MINSLYMFREPIGSSSGGTEYTTIGMYGACYVGWLLTGLEDSNPASIEITQTTLHYGGKEIILRVIRRSVENETN